MKQSVRGFALLAVLWFSVAFTVLISIGLRSARLGLLTSGNRIGLERNAWAAEACLNVALARLDSAQRAGGNLEPLPGASLGFRNGTRCATTMLDPGSMIDPDSAHEVFLAVSAALAVSNPHPEAAAESLLTRDGGGTINLNSAPPVVLAALPGFLTSTVDYLLEARRSGRRPASLDDLMGALDSRSRDSLAAHYGRLRRLTSFAASRLVVRIAGMDDRGRLPVFIEIVVIPVGGRVAVIRRRA